MIEDTPLAQPELGLILQFPANSDRTYGQYSLRQHPDGTFEISHVHGGAYIITGGVRLAATAGQPSEYRSVYQPLRVDRDLNDVRVVMRVSSPEIKGMVRSEDNKPPPLFTGIPGPLHLGLRSVVTARWDASLAVLPDGSLGPEELRGPPAREYHPELWGLDEEYYVRSITFDGKDVAYTSFNLPPQGGAFEVVVAQGAAAVKGTIRDASGAPIAAPVTIWAPGTRGQFSKTVLTQEDGTFKFSNVPPGELRIAAWERMSTGLAQFFEFYSAFDAQAQPLTTRSGEVTNIDITVIPLRSGLAQAAKLQ